MSERNWAVIQVGLIFPPLLFLSALTAILAGTGVSSPRIRWLISPVFSMKVSKQLKNELLKDYVTVKRGLVVLSVHCTRLSHNFLLMFAVLLGGEPASWGRQRRASWWSGCRGIQNPEVIFIRELSGAPCPGHRCQSSGDRKGNLPSSWLLLVPFLYLWSFYKRTYQEYFRQ